MSSRNLLRLHSYDPHDGSLQSRNHHPGAIAFIQSQQHSLAVLISVLVDDAMSCVSLPGAPAVQPIRQPNRIVAATTLALITPAVVCAEVSPLLCTLCRQLCLSPAVDTTIASDTACIAAPTKQRSRIATIRTKGARHPASQLRYPKKEAIGGYVNSSHVCAGTFPPTFPCVRTHSVTATSLRAHTRCYHGRRGESFAAAWNQAEGHSRDRGACAQPSFFARPR